MIKFKISLLACVAVLMAFPAFAGLYTSAGLGYVLNTGSSYKNGVRSDLDESGALSLAVGYDFPMIDLVRVEGEYLHNRAKNEKETGKTNFDSLMANGYIDIPFPFPLLTPYVGAGIGYARFESDNCLAYQGMLGIDAAVFVIPLITSLEYRYTRTSSPSESGNDTYKYYGNTVLLKLRYEF